MKLIRWNVNGLRACLTHGFAESFAALDADIFSVQETKMQPGQADFAPEGYTEYTYSAEKKGYSGTACWCKTAPLAVTTGIGLEQHDHEGRVLTLEYPGFYLVNCYTPNSQDGLKRLDYRMEWEDAFRAYLLALDAKKPVILCGDFNVAREHIDIYPENLRNELEPPGFQSLEREGMERLLALGLTDVFRAWHPHLQAKGAYGRCSCTSAQEECGCRQRIDTVLFATYNNSTRQATACVCPSVEVGGCAGRRRLMELSEGVVQ